MTPQDPIRPQYNRAAAKAAGATDAEIDAVIAEYEASQQNRPQPRRDSTPSDAVRQISAQKPADHAGEDPTARSQFRPDNLVRQAMQGATFGTFDELSGGADALVRKATGDKRPMGDLYREARDKSRWLSNAYKEENPVTSALAQATGALSTGRFLPNIPVGSATPAASVMGRAGQAAAKGVANGAWQGAVSGGLATDGTFDERMQGATRGALAGGAIGGVGGGVLSAASDLLRKGGDKVASYKAARALDQGRVQEVPVLDDVSTAEAFERTLAKSGKTEADLRALQDDPSPNTIGGQLGNAGIRRTGVAYRRGLKEPTNIAESLDARAKDEAPNLYAKGRELTGRDIRDTQGFRNEQFDKAKPEVEANWRVAAPKEVPREAVESVASDIDKLRRDGVDVWRNTRVAYEDFPATAKGYLPKGEVPPVESAILDASGKPFLQTPDVSKTLNVGELRKLRESLDGMIDYSGQPLADSHTKAAQMRLKALRHDVDALVKEHGGEEARAADKVYSTAAKRSRSFELGEETVSGRDPRSDTPEGLGLIRGESDPDALQSGAASELLNRIRKAGDGDAGAVTNPARGVVGSPITDARSETAFIDKPENFGKFKDEARGVTNRLRERQSIMGGSQTAERHADDQTDAISDAVNLLAQGRPAAAARGAMAKQWDKAGRLFTGQSLDAEAKILMAGAPGQMSRREALDLLEAARKVLARRRTVTTEAASNRGGAIGRAAGSAGVGRN